MRCYSFDIVNRVRWENVSSASLIDSYFVRTFSNISWGVSEATDVSAPNMIVNTAATVRRCILVTVGSRIIEDGFQFSFCLDQDVTGLAPIERSDNTRCLQFVHQTRRAGIPDLQSSLQERD